MSQLTITCPHCGFSKDVERQRIPAGVRNITCPKCKQPFAFQKSEAPGAQQPQQAAVSEELSVEMPPRPQPQQASAEREAAPPPGQSKLCPTCHQRIHVKAEICPRCGVRVAAPKNAVNKTALLLMTFFLGGLGGHKFYQKKYLLGVLYLLFFWTYIPSLVAFIEFVVYAFRSEDELQRMYPETSSAGIIVALGALMGIAIIGILAAIAIPQFASYREKAYNAAATSDLKDCVTEAEAYYADHSAYPTDPGEFECRASKNVALYYFSLGPDKYQVISFNNMGRKAFLRSSDDDRIKQNTKEEIKRQIADKFGSGEVGPSFHFER